MVPYLPATAMPHPGFPRRLFLDIDEFLDPVETDNHRLGQPVNRDNSLSRTIRRDALMQRADFPGGMRDPGQSHDLADHRFQLFGLDGGADQKRDNFHGVF
jgi:hypothetical protein